MVVSSERPRIPSETVRPNSPVNKCVRTSEVLGVLVMDQRSEVATVVEDHVERLVAREGSQGLLNAPEVLLLGLPLPREDRDASSSDTTMSTISNYDPVALHRILLTLQLRGPGWRRCSV